MTIKVERHQSLHDGNEDHQDFEASSGRDLRRKQDKGRGQAKNVATLLGQHKPDCQAPKHTNRQGSLETTPRSAAEREGKGSNQNDPHRPHRIPHPLSLHGIDIPSRLVR